MAGSPLHRAARKALRVCTRACSTPGCAAPTAAGVPRHSTLCPLWHGYASAVTLAVAGRARTDADGRGGEGAGGWTGLGQV